MCQREASNVVNVGALVMAPAFVARGKLRLGRKQQQISIEFIRLYIKDANRSVVPFCADEHQGFYILNDPGQIFIRDLAEQLYAQTCRLVGFAGS